MQLVMFIKNIYEMSMRAIIMICLMLIVSQSFAVEVESTSIDEVNVNQQTKPITKKSSPYISFDPTIDNPTTNDPRIKTIITYANISSTHLTVGYINANNFRFANKLKELLLKNNIADVTVLDVSNLSKYNNNYVYVFME